MLHIESIPFNPFQVNTYLLYDETGECAIIDPACYGSQEEEHLRAYIKEKQLKPVCVVNTHCHIDHILGNNYVFETYGLKPVIHRDGLSFLENAVEYATTFGFQIQPPVMPVQFVADGEKISIGNQSLQVLEAPGHAAGSICLYHSQQKFVIVGDVLFQSGIGRTDLPTGDYNTLITSIQNKLLTLPDDTVVYCGHGPQTTIGQERQMNPYL